jgi:hypothetical protein
MADQITPAAGTSPEATPEVNDGKSYSQADLDALAGKVRKEEREKHEKELSQTVSTKVEEAVKEAQRLAKLSADEREKELLAEQSKKNQAKEQELTLRENRADAIEALTELNIPKPKEAAEFVVDLDKKKQEEKIANFNEIVTTLAQALVEDQLKGDTPKDINAKPGTTVPTAVTTTL